MVCPKCGENNVSKFKFCVKCGCNLDDPQEVNYEQVDMGGYHTENEPSGGFTLGSGTFTISDNPAPNSSQGMFTADELNSSDEEFDFSGFDEPFIPTLDADRLSMPSSPSPQRPPQQMGGMPQQMGGMPQQMGGMPQQMGGMPQQMGGMPQQMMYGQPQIIGYDQSGMPIYGQAQPMMYGQPQIIGYDQNGMPMYAPAPQPQIIGYDQNGMPIYGQAQPMMYGQPQIIGYDQSGMPIYGQAQPVMGNMPMGGMPAQHTPVQPQSQPKKETKKNEFWDDFFDNGNSSDNGDDFFGKSDPFGSSVGKNDSNRLKKLERKKNTYMNDTPLVDASNLQPNTADKFNKMYMRKTEMVNASDLSANVQTKKQDIMNVTDDVSGETLAAYERKKNNITMYKAGEADASQLEAYNREKKESIMASADHAVEAMPKKKVYADEVDNIELTALMKARKAIREENPDIPALPDI